MSGMDYDNIEAGRKMDAEIARRIFDCQVLNERGEGYICNCPMAKHGSGDYADIQSYSTDISAAWRVVKVYDPEYNVKLYNHGEGWTFVIYKDATHYEADAPTAPLAICRAALKAVTSARASPLEAR